IRDMIKTIGEMIEIEPVIQEDPSLPAPVPLRYVSDLTRAENELGWRIQIGVTDGLQVIL
ncbi:MAG TPA: hypothetical protein VFR12_03310, partial [Pyrinomonadaceae bacterium]|nr:hypothetical protein [Pyrinomonadaceae bacterium]